MLGGAAPAGMRRARSRRPPPCNSRWAAMAGFAGGAASAPARLSETKLAPLARARPATTMAAPSHWPNDRLAEHQARHDDTERRDGCDTQRRGRRPQPLHEHHIGEEGAEGQDHALEYAFAESYGQGCETQSRRCRGEPDREGEEAARSHRGDAAERVELPFAGEHAEGSPHQPDRAEDGGSPERLGAEFSPRGTREDAEAEQKHADAEKTRAGRPVPTATPPRARCTRSSTKARRGSRGSPASSRSPPGRPLRKVHRRGARRPGTGRASRASGRAAAHRRADERAERREAVAKGRDVPGCEASARPSLVAEN